MLAIGLLGIITACSSEEPVDLEAIEVELSTNPETVTAGSQVDLQATVTGLSVSDKTRVRFDVRIGDEPQLFDAVHEGNGVFSGPFTFPVEGPQAVYIHLYADDIHITKKKQVEVE